MGEVRTQSGPACATLSPEPVDASALRIGRQAGYCSPRLACHPQNTPHNNNYIIFPKTTL